MLPERAWFTELGKVGDVVRQKGNMKKPTIQEIQAYLDENNYSLDAKSFWLHYEQKGWLVGKSPMKKWKSAVGLWAHNGWGQTSQSRTRWAKRNVQAATDARKHQRGLYLDYFRSLTIRALQDKRRDPGALGHVVWLMDEVIKDKFENKQQKGLGL